MREDRERRPFSTFTARQREFGAATLACGGNTEGRPWSIPSPSSRGLAHGDARQGTSPWEPSLSTYV